MPTQTVVGVSMPKEMVKELDKEASNRFMNRSEFVRYLFRNEMQEDE
jgi:metal-responsive CopG/Arc/MetJ family transcriptional regulator